MPCNNCYNGCTEIVSDRCVKYTGIDIPELGIQTGDTLSSVEQSITTYLVSVLNGSGVKIDISDIDVCNTVQKYLPVCSACTDVSIADIATALIKAACDIQAQVDAIASDITTINDVLSELNSTYIKECLTGTINVTDTHSVLQAVIYNFCALKLSLNEYVTVLELPDLIQGYLDSTGSANLISNRMVPYAVVPYFGPLTNFNSDGAGLAVSPSGENWSNIYLCNGVVAPDLRGFGLVGAINGVPGGALNSRVDPSIPGANNPNYSLYTIDGLNQVTLTSAQIPPLTHTHGNTTVSTVDEHGGHSHTTPFGNPQDANTSGSTNSWVQTGTSQNYATSTVQTGITVGTTVTINDTTLGQGLPHSNIQPVVACYYIQYRP